MDDIGLEELGLSDDLVIGEAVVLDLRAASFATRALACALDVLVIFILAFGLGWLVLGTAVGFDSAGVGAAVTLFIVTVFVIVPATVETLSRGRSLGKLAAGLRVVRDDGGPTVFRHSIIRALYALVEIYPFGVIAVIASLSNRRGKRLGDMAAGTYVVRERTPVSVSPPPWPPPELAGWAAVADLGRLPDRLAMAARTFLARTATLHPASRTRLAESLATQVAMYVAPPPPAGTHPERFLAAVLAERRRRDLARLQAEQAARLARDTRRRRASPLAAMGTTLIGDDVT